MTKPSYNELGIQVQIEQYLSKLSISDEFPFSLESRIKEIRRIIETCNLVLIELGSDEE